jgi:glucan phosphoethanolaminetransferase (alkaline phosphatase superfamily)
MKLLKWPGLFVGLALLVIGTVMVFTVFDRDSHSASDTLRPFLITMTPVWALAIAAAIVLVRRRGTP